MKQRVIIFAGGTLRKSFLKEIRDNDFVIGVDRGAHWLLMHGVVPDMAIGDFDSVTNQELAGIRKRVKAIAVYPEEKDATDLELAVGEAIKRGAGEVVMFGGVGSRMDHTLGALHLLEILANKGIMHVLRDGNNSTRFIGRGRTILKGGGHRYASIIPYTKTISLTLTGFRYNVPKTTLRRGTTRAISNEISEAEAVITLHAGKAWVIQSRD